MDGARWFWRAIEGDDHWLCRRGMCEIDTHPTLDESLDHLCELAAVEPPAEIFAHYLDGTVESKFRVD